MEPKRKLRSFYVSSYFIFSSSFWFPPIFNVFLIFISFHSSDSCFPSCLQTVRRFCTRMCDTDSQHPIVLFEGRSNPIRIDMWFIHRSLRSRIIGRDIAMRVVAVSRQAELTIQSNELITHFFLHPHFRPENLEWGKKSFIYSLSKGSPFFPDC